MLIAKRAKSYMHSGIPLRGRSEKRDIPVAAGIVYFVAAGPFVLPEKGASADPGATSKYFEDIYGIEGEIFEAKVTLKVRLSE